MSNSTISLEKSVRTCDVNVGEAHRIQSDRFFNPYSMVCVPWNGLNSKGQPVCPDSFNTKTAGCHSAEDRVVVENGLRPKYINYVTLGAQGISGHIYGNEMAYKDSLARDNFNDSRDTLTGNFGHQWTANVDHTGCSVGAYERGMAQMSQNVRKQAMLQNGYMSNSYKAYSGN
jgi:hypothetical protein